MGIAVGGFETAAICCAYAVDSAEASPGWLRMQLRRALPDYMLPSRWKHLDRLPKNANGKLHRRALRQRFEKEAQQRTGTAGRASARG